MPDDRDAGQRPRLRGAVVTREIEVDVAEQLRLACLREYAVLDAPAEAGFDRITRLAARILGVPYAALTFVDLERIVLPSSWGLDVQEMPRAQGLCDRVVRESALVHHEDARDDPIARAHPLVCGELSIRFYAGAPLVAEGGHTLGTLCALGPKPRALSDVERDTLFDLAACAMELIERRRAQRTLDAVRDELEMRVDARTSEYLEATRQLEAVFAAHPDMLFVLSRHGEILRFNSTHEALASISHASFEGKRMSDVLPRKAALQFARAMGLARSSGGMASLEFELQLPGALHIFETRIVPLGAERVVAVIRDVTSLENAQASLRRSERLACVGTMAAGMAHQLNNPLGAILNGAQLALLQEDDAEFARLAREILETNVALTRRCGRIVKSMLQFSRSQPSERWVEDLNVVIRRASEAVLAQLGSREASLRFDASPEACPVHMSPIEMEQAVVNVLRNALESGDRGVRVQIRTRLEQAVVRVEIEDEGRGMALEQIEHAFDPFYTSRLRDGGAGLGLSVSHGLVVSHGGAIRVESKEGRGTRVTIELPRHRGDEELD